MAKASLLRPAGAAPKIWRRRLLALALLCACLGAPLALLGLSGRPRPAQPRQPKRVAKRLPPPPSLKEAEEAAIEHVLSYTPAVVEGGRRGNYVALTFDDGPGPYTAELVATLKRLQAKATFFAIGEMERYFAAGTAAELAAGEAVEDHTETHAPLAILSAAAQRAEIEEAAARLELVGVPRPHLLRPPYGSFNQTTFQVARSLHMLMVLWSVDTADYLRPGVGTIVERALAGAHPGAIILLHDGGGDRAQTIAALPAIVAGLRARHLQPVTVPELLLYDPPPPGQPLPTNLSGD